MQEGANADFLSLLRRQIQRLRDRKRELADPAAMPGRVAVAGIEGTGERSDEFHVGPVQAFPGFPNRSPSPIEALGQILNFLNRSLFRMELLQQSSLFAFPQV